MVSRGPKRGRQSSATPSPPSSVKRTRSSATNPPTTAHTTRGAMNFPTVSSQATQDVTHGYPTGEASASRPPPDTVSNSVLRARALAATYKPPVADLGQQGTYTPVASLSHDLRRGSGGSSRRGPREMALAGLPLHEIGLGLPMNLEANHATSRARDLERELGFQSLYPPVLPPSDVPDLAPKTQTQVLLPVHPEATKEEREYIEARNNQIALDNKAKDRQRNNQAAKKSRELRIESLTRSKDMLAQATAKVHWLRLRLLAKGDREALSIWEQLRCHGVVERFANSIRERVEAVENDRSEDKKKKDSQARVVLNRERSQIRAASSQRISKEREVAMEAAALSEAEGISTLEALNRLDAQSSRQSSRRPSNPQQVSTQQDTSQPLFRTSSRRQSTEDGSYMTPQQQMSFAPGTADQAWSMSTGDGFSGQFGPVSAVDPFGPGSASNCPQSSEDAGLPDSPSVRVHRQREQFRSHATAADDPFLTSIALPRFNMRHHAPSDGSISQMQVPNMALEQNYTIPQPDQESQLFDPALWPSFQESIMMSPQSSIPQVPTFEHAVPVQQEVYFPPASTLDLPQPLIDQAIQQQEDPSSLFEINNYNVSNPDAQQ